MLRALPFLLAAGAVSLFAQAAAPTQLPEIRGVVLEPETNQREQSLVHCSQRRPMYCPECRVEYREGFTECADCHVALLAGAPPAEEADPFDPSLELVVVLETNNPMQVAMAKGLLEEAEIPYSIPGQITRLVNDIDPFLNKWMRVQVPRDREAEARELLEPVLHPETWPPATDADAGVTP